MEDLSTRELMTLQKECEDRLEAATKEIALMNILIPGFKEEIEVRRTEYEMDRD